MSLITRCPACETMFKVVPDQLRISSGWVRCGQCEEVFDASAHLQEVQIDPAASEQAGPEVPAPAPAAPEPDVDVDIDIEIGDEVLPSPLAQVEPSDETPDASGQSRTEPVLDADVPAPTEAPAWMAERASAPGVSFMREQKSASFWHRPLVRASLMLVCMVLVAGLAVQVIVHERDRIAALAPKSRPVLRALCSVMRCAVSPLRQIESIVIDSSSFNKIRGDAYRLNFTLKNTAPTGLALPAIELSLTDAQDQPVMRRVFLPSEFGATSDVLHAGSESSGSLALSVKANGNAERIAGYRLLAFYP